LQKDLAPIPESGHAFVSAINGYDGCNVTFCTLPLGSAHCPVVMPNQTTTGEEMFQLAAGKQRWEVGFEVKDANEVESQTLSLIIFISGHELSSRQMDG